MSIGIYYGVEGNYCDVTKIAFQQCVKNNMLDIPPTESERAYIFGDPVYGILKHIKVERMGVISHYLNNEGLRLFLSLEEINYIQNLPEPIYTSPEQKLAVIHNKLKFIGGNIRDEYPEQIMAVLFIEENDKVLEIGSNIGRNTLTIASLLKDQRKLVTLECDPTTHKALVLNKNINGFGFYSEDAALSYKPLVLNGWNSLPSDIDLPNYVRVRTLTFQEIESKYDIIFNTLVADCEGALYYIFQDYPDMLNNITKIIMENDYFDIDHKNFVDQVIKSKGFNRIYCKEGGWGPCYHNFYEVWSK